MRFKHVNRYDATPAEVLAMLVTADFREQVCREQRALDHSVDVTVDGTRTTVVISQAQAMDGAPAAARSMVGSSVEIVQREVWRRGDGLPEADFSVEIPGRPGHLRGGITFREHGDGTCEEVFAGEVKVKVPLVGRTLEGFIGDILARALRREGRVGATWLEEHRG